MNSRLQRAEYENELENWEECLHAESVEKKYFKRPVMQKSRYPQHDTNGS
jgi:hypothetical protein